MTSPDIKELAVTVGHAALAKKELLATAESLTAGAIAAAITEAPGSSGWFERGFVTYLPIAKEEMLGVRHETIAMHGVVSEETAREMAQGALTHSHATLSVSVTGIAGPTGAEPGKPVGTVCFGFAHAGDPVKTETCHFTGDRDGVRQATVRHALEGLLAILQK